MVLPVPFPIDPPPCAQSSQLASSSRMKDPAGYKIGLPIGGRGDETEIGTWKMLNQYQIPQT